MLGNPKPPGLTAADVKRLNINVCCECGRRIAKGIKSNICPECLEAALRDTEEVEAKA